MAKKICNQIPKNRNLSEKVCFRGEYFLLRTVSFWLKAALAFPVAFFSTVICLKVYQPAGRIVYQSYTG